MTTTGRIVTIKIRSRVSLVGVYFPDYMDGINMPGWHLHFLSEDRAKGGHVFDTYSLKQDLQEEIKSVE